MSLNVHRLHVRADTAEERAALAGLLLAHAEREGYERVARARAADRVIRLGHGRRWVTVDDDGGNAAELALALQAASATFLDAHCEASALVGMQLVVGGEPVGGWGGGVEDLPPAGLVEPLLAEGDAAGLAAAWEEGLRQIFPETALANAARRFGISTAYMLDDPPFRGATIALRRRRAAWTPRFREGPPALEVSFRSNREWGERHLLFEGQVEDHWIPVTSVGGPGRGLRLRLSGNALDDGLVELLDVTGPGLELVADGDGWVDRRKRIAAGLVDTPDAFTITAREQRRVLAAEATTQHAFRVRYRTLRQGDGELTAEVSTGDSLASSTVGLKVLWRPFRPLAAVRDEPHVLFALHRREHVALHVTLKVPLAQAWAWAEPHVVAWSRAQGDETVRVMRDDDVLFREGGDDPPWDRVAALVGGRVFQAASRSALLGTFSSPPYGAPEDEPLVVQLLLGGVEEDEPEAQLALLSAVADEAIGRGLAHSALLCEQRSMPQEATAWEELTVRNPDPLKLASWHATHLRGLDKQVWMSSAHAAGLDREALERHAEVTDLGGGIRLVQSRDRPRADLRALEELLGDRLPSEPQAEAVRSAWRERHLRR